MHKARWTLEKISARLQFLSEAAIYRRTQALMPFKFRAGSQPLVGIDVDDGDWEVIEAGSYWGELRQEFTLRTSFAAPRDWVQPVALLLPLGVSKSLEALSFLYGPEALAYLDGEAYQGVDPNHQELSLPGHVLDGEEHHLALHGWAGIKDERYEMGLPCLAQIDQPTRDFMTAADAALEVAKAAAGKQPYSCQLAQRFGCSLLAARFARAIGRGLLRERSCRPACIEGGYCQVGFADGCRR